MRKITKLIVPLFMVSALTACDSDSDNDKNAESGISYLRVIHASADAPKVNVLANGQIIEGLAAVDFEQGSSLLQLPAGNYAVSVDAILPDNTTTKVLDLGSVELKSDTENTVVAHGKVMADDSTANDLAAALITTDKTMVGDGNIRLNVLHAAENAPTVDLHVTSATAELGSPLATLAYGATTGQVEVAAGVYRVRLVVSAGNAGAGTVAYDAVLPNLAPGSDLFVTAVPNVGVTTSPVVLLANTGSDTLKIIDDRTTSWVRVSHTAADVPNVDVLVNSSKVDALSNLSFTATKGYVPLAEGNYTVDTVLTSDNSVVGITGPLSPKADMKYSVLAVGTLAQEAGTDVPLEYYVLTDNTRRVATESKLRLTHAHPSVGNVDIYITADGNITNASPMFRDIPYKATTDFISVGAGDYVVQVTPTGAKTPIAIDTGTVSLAVGGIYSAIAINNTAGTPANVMLVDDFVKP